MDWVLITYSQVVQIVITTVVIYFGSLLLIKINGLRSLSKMSSHGYIVSLAIASICASTIIQGKQSILQGLLAISLLLLFQSIYSIWRRKKRKVHLENEPILLMKGADILEENLAKTKVTKADLFAKLREANVLDLNDVKAVVFEQTGDISVLHGKKELDEAILFDVHPQT